jgi:hypothetical protein
MNDLTKTNNKDLLKQDPVINAHEFLVAFLNKFETAKRGGIHDFMEITIFNMLNLAIGDVDKYLSQGHREVNANQVMMIVADSYQKVLDNIKRNLESMKEVTMR